MPVYKLEYYPLQERLMACTDRIFTKNEVKGQVSVSLTDKILAWLVTTKLTETAQYSSHIPLMLKICLTLKPCSAILAN